MQNHTAAGFKKFLIKSKNVS